jgi:hypothetical protein
MVRIGRGNVSDAIVGEFIDALVNDRQRAEVLLSAQPDLLNARWMHDETVVHFLAVEGFLDAVTFLADRGADLKREKILAVLAKYGHKPGTG